MSSSVTQQPFGIDRIRSRRLTFEDRYFLLLLMTLVGYAIGGKAFAYLGLPPLFVGEIVLGLGVIAFLRSGCLLASLSSVTSVILMVLICLAVVHCAIDVPSYGFDALRDGVIVIYGVYAFIMAGLLLAKPSRLEMIIDCYGRLAAVYVIAGPVVTVASILMSGRMFSSFGTLVVLVRPGELGVHLAGVTVFALLGFRRFGLVWALLLLTAIAIVCAQNRGGMLAFIIPTMIAAAFAKQPLQIIKVGLLAIALLCMIAVTGIDLPLSGFNPERNLGFDSIMANIGSLFGGGNSGNLDGTREWRMRWWASIVQYTWNGDYFWSGKGFGINLADADGYVVGTELQGNPLRSPHNGHMTILARLGVPGIVLWVMLLISWFGMMARNVMTAWRLGERMWARFFVFIATYALAAIIDASFDVALEGPMIGIWFWVLIGAGIGTSIIYRARFTRRPQVGAGR